MLTRPNDHEADLANDMKFFVNAEARQQEHAARGTLSAKDARNAASRRFGNRARSRRARAG